MKREVGSWQRLRGGQQLYSLSWAWGHQLTSSPVNPGTHWDPSSAWAGWFLSPRIPSISLGRHHLVPPRDNGAIQMEQEPTNSQSSPPAHGKPTPLELCRRMSLPELSRREVPPFLCAFQAAEGETLQRELQLVCWSVGPAASLSLSRMVSANQRLRRQSRATCRPINNAVHGKEPR